MGESRDCSGGRSARRADVYGCAGRHRPTANSGADRRGEHTHQPMDGGVRKAAALAENQQTGEYGPATLHPSSFVNRIITLVNTREVVMRAQSFVGVGLLAGAVFTIGASVQSQGVDPLPALLAEVHALRVTMEQQGSVGPRIQLTMARLNIQEQRVTH